MTLDSTTALATVAGYRYVSLTTFRRTGEGVSTPVWIARDGDELVVITVDGVGKTKRLKGNPVVELRPCDMRGQVADGAPTFTGTARVVRDEAGVASVKRAIGAKYAMARLGDAVASVTDRLRKRTPRAGIRITLT
ncbi:hypothetical protein N865_15930 [Intrasporangium oryzae NRRL B-24470]|uniref:Pyridoxamine 5'-phosphate oxidase N-terminal domain-containing protein n=1 Tax=Intrasporangium oryzae NRRL B-24470 TaxID=1386089 RepID=W9G517_9MICO|nr:PPOX class F420-dependent oxidoreductase [Intrasporangium oryzae]EWT00407.1 hypothetical protein N865_15930 [Intrasporangium oryzae NRRL B-24470]